MGKILRGAGLKLSLQESGIVISFQKFLVKMVIHGKYVSFNEYSFLHFHIFQELYKST